MKSLRLGIGVVSVSVLALGLAGCGAAHPKKTAPEGTKEIAAAEPGVERERKRGRERERAERLIPELPRMSRAEFEQKIMMLVAVDDVDLVTSELVERYLSEEDIPPMFQGGLELLLHFILGPSLASACDLSQPAALALGGDEATGDYRMLVGIRLRRNAEDSLAGAFDLVPLGRDVVLLEPREQEGLGVLGSQFDCVVNTSEERPPYLICGTPADELGRLAPHVTEWIADRPRGPVISLELSSSFLTQVLLEAAAEDPMSDDPSEALGEAMAIQWFESLGKIVLRGELVANGLAIDLALHQPRDGGMIGALFNSASAEGETVPPEFEVLPADTMLAISIAPRDGASVAAPIDGFSGAFEQEELGELRNDVVDLLDEVKAIAAAEKPARIAIGLDEQRALKKLEKLLGQDKKKKKNKNKKPNKRKPDFAKVQAALYGWFAVGISSDVEAWNGFLVRLHELESRSVAREKKKSKGRGQAEADEEPSKSLTTMKLKKLKQSDRLPPGSVYLRIDEKPNPKWKPVLPGDEPAVRSTTHLISATGKDTTWLVGAADRKRAVEIARMLTSGEGRVPPAMRQSFRPQRMERPSALGFMTPLFFEVFAVEDDTREGLEQLVETLRRLAAEPTGGRSPLPVAVLNETGPDGEAVLRLSIELPDSLIRRVFEEASAAEEIAGEGGFQEGFQDGFGPLKK